MNTIDYTRTQQQGLYFLSKNTQFILKEIIQNVPLLMTISHLQMRQKHMWTDENRGQALVTQLSNLTYKYIRELAMKITEEICNLSSHNFQMVVDYLHYNCDALRMEFKLPKFLPIFFRTVFAQCKQHLQAIRLQPPNESNQQVQMKAAPTASKTSSSTQQYSYHSIRTASQASIVQSAPSLNHISPNSQMCPIIVSNTHSNGPPQTNTCLPLQGARPIWQSNGNNEMLTYQPVQTNQLQAMSAMPMQFQQQQFVQQNTNSNPQLQAQFGVCGQSATMRSDMQYASSANQVAVNGQIDWPMQTFSSYSSVNTNLNQNAMQAHYALPVLRSVDVALALQNVTQHAIGTQAINTICVLNSNNINCSSAYGYQNGNQTKFVDFHKNSENAIQDQSKLNNSQSVPIYTKLSMTAKSARAPVPQPLIIPRNVDRKRSAASIASTNTVEAAAPPEKVFTISSNTELRSPASAKGVQPNGDSISLKSRAISTGNVYEKDHEIKYDSKSRATILASAISPAALNESSIDATEIIFGTADLRLSEPRTSKAFTFNAEEEKSSFPKTIYSLESQYEESDDFEILVQTSTDTEVKATIEKTELSEKPPGECDELIDLCDSSNDNDLDVAVVKTVDEIVSKPKIKVSRFSSSINCNSATADSGNS